METLDKINNNDTEIPSFLKVLCILTFIGSGLGILTGFLILLAFPVMERIASLAQLQEASIMIGVMTIMINAGTLFGALWMWKKNVKGFYLYVIAQLLNMGSPFILNLIYHIQMTNNFFAYSIPVAFIGMYATNYNYLKNHGNN